MAAKLAKMVIYLDFFFCLAYRSFPTEETLGDCPRFVIIMLTFLRMLVQTPSNRQPARDGRVAVALMTFTGQR